MLITADQVKDLREKTGARMMDCKAALAACNADFDASVAWLKQKNLDTGDKAAQNAANEGLLGYDVDGGVLVVVEMSANTDFATGSIDFKDALRIMVKSAHEIRATSADDLMTSPTIGQQVQSTMKELSGKLGENIAIKRIVRQEGNFGFYIHHNNKEGAIVEIDGATGEIAEKIGKDMAMHIVFSKPLYLSRKEIPAAEVDKENAIIAARFADDPKNAKKPPQIIQKIFAGQLDKVFAKSVLVDQPYFREDKKTVSQILTELGVTIKSFVRFQVGG